MNYNKFKCPTSNETALTWLMIETYSSRSLITGATSNGHQRGNQGPLP